MANRGPRQRRNAEEDEIPGLTQRLARLVQHHVFRPHVLLVLAVVASGFVALPRVMRLIPDLRERGEYQVAAQDIEIVPSPPDWIPADFIDQALRDSGNSDSVFMLDNSVNEMMAKAFAAHPWVEKVVRVERAVPARIVVELEFRRPVAMVQVKQGLYPVDAQGLLLPPDGFSSGDVRRYPLIQGVLSTPHGPAGTAWGDVTVVGAARLADVLSSAWQELELQAIVAPRLERADVDIEGLAYELTTPGGTRIIWGRAPGSNNPGELAAAQKIGRLQKYRSDFGGFDRQHGPYEIDIRHWQEIMWRPLASNRDGEQH